MKKTLNLDFVELERLEGSTDVCLMPCPCSSSYTTHSDAYEWIDTQQGTGGFKCAAKVAVNILSPTELNQGEDCMVAINSFCADHSISQADCQALQADACGCGGSK